LKEVAVVGVVREVGETLINKSQLKFKFINNNLINYNQKIKVRILLKVLLKKEIHI